jgi:hypothetical protein
MEGSVNKREEVEDVRMQVKKRNDEHGLDYISL